MTETEWLAAIEPTPMLEFLQGKASERKQRLFAVACCRNIWPLLLDQSSRNAVNVAERFADGVASDAEIAAAADALGVDLETKTHGFNAAEDADSYAAEAAYMALGDTTDVHIAARNAAFYAVAATIAGVSDNEDLAQSRMIRDIFGNPFCKRQKAKKTWLTSDVVALARQMYESRDFSPMPILADALQDAGCDNEDILNHCRQAGEHVRGCWVVDLLTGRK